MDLSNYAIFIFIVFLIFLEEILQYWSNFSHYILLLNKIVFNLII